MKSAAPTLKERLEGLLWVHRPNESEIRKAHVDGHNLGIREAIALSEPAPPAAERTALKELKMKVEALKFKKGMHSNNLGRPILDYNEAINDALSEIDASEGTKSE